MKSLTNKKELIFKLVLFYLFFSSNCLYFSNFSINQSLASNSTKAFQFVAHRVLHLLILGLVLFNAYLHFFSFFTLCINHSKLVEANAKDSDIHSNSVHLYLAFLS
jgi:uncharacterized membrane-anchored protein YitT (DUF2179 family)